MNQILEKLFVDVYETVPSLLPLKDRVRNLQESYRYAAPEREGEFWYRLSSLLNRDTQPNRSDWELKIYNFYHLAVSMYSNGKERVA